MTTGMINATQIPGSLRAIDSVAGLYRDSTRDVGRRVHGHSGGLAIKERYLLAEKRENILIRAREESIKHREEGRHLRGKLVGIAKHARKAVQRAQLGRGYHLAEREECSIATNPKFTDTLDTVSSRSRIHARREISSCVGAVQLVLTQMRQTLNMARARRELRMQIAEYQRHEEQEAKPEDEEHRVANVTLVPPSSDTEVRSPRSRYRRRRAATCLQRHVRGRQIRKASRQLMWAMIHFQGAKKFHRFSKGRVGRRAVLFEMFRATLAAWERVPRDCLSAGVENLPLPRAVDATTLGINIPAIVPETDLLSASARDTVARESRTVAWALHDTAARILQEEVRHYARSRLKRRLKFEAIQDEDRAKGDCGSPRWGEYLVDPAQESCLLADGVSQRGNSTIGSCGRFLLKSEEAKKRRNEAHMRKNHSRLKKLQRSAARLEHQGSLVLPELVQIQRIFRAMRARRIYDEERSKQTAHESHWAHWRRREGDECAARWKAAISRLRRIPNGSGLLACTLPGIKGGGLANVVDEAARHASIGAHEDEWDSIYGKSLAYANEKWGLAVAYDLGSWHGGWRQRHYFKRLVAFLCYRRRLREALRQRVECRMLRRLKMWVRDVAESKHVFAGEVKARAPPEVFGAHLRFLSHGGSWERMLGDLDDLMTAAEAERERASEMLRARCPQFFTTTNPRRSPAFLTAAPQMPTVSSPARASKVSPCRLGAQATAGSPMRERRKPPLEEEMSGTRHLAHGTVDGFPRQKHFPGNSFVTTISDEGPHDTGSRAPALDNISPKQLARLKDLVGDRLLRCLHPWLLAALAASRMQFLPSLSFENRVGNRIKDTNEAEVQAEAQLTRRYWDFLHWVSWSLLTFRNATQDARALTVEFDEWNLLLEFARYLSTIGLLEPPCDLPMPPRRDAAFRPASGGGACGDADVSRKPLKPFRRISNLGVLKPKGRERSDGKPSRSSGEPGSSLRWFLFGKDLCNTCYALCSGRRWNCVQCGSAKTTFQIATSNDRLEASGPISWQHFNKINAPPDLFIIHAAFACILHPGGYGNFRRGAGGGWWSGGTQEEAWWRAACGGKQAAENIRGFGCDTLGKLFALATGTPAKNAASCTEREQRSRRGIVAGDGHGPRRARECLVGEEGGKLRQLLKDEGLAMKISSLLQRLMVGFKYLRDHKRWPTVSRRAVEHAVRRLQPPLLGS